MTRKMIDNRDGRRVRKGDQGDSIIRDKRKQRELSERAGPSHLHGGGEAEPGGKKKKK